MSKFSDFYVDQLEKDLLWREQELSVLRKHLLLTEPGSSQERTFLRTNLAMTYAHYEGFCKFALGVYIDALEKLSLKRTDLKWPIAASTLSRFQREIKEHSRQDDFFTSFLDKFEAELTSTAVFERPENIANLWPDLLISWQKRLGLITDTVQSQSTRLHNLVDSRNQIAHGKKLTVQNRDELDKHSHAATLAMHEVAVGIADALEKELYLRRNQVMTVIPHATVENWIFSPS